MRHYVIIIILLELLISCYSEIRVNPNQTNQSSNGGNTNSTNQNLATATTVNKIINYTSSFSSKADSNDNNRYSFVTLSFNCTFSKGGKFKYKLFAQDYDGNMSKMAFDSSSLITIPNNLNFSFYNIIKGDVIYPLFNYSRSDFNLFIKIQDSLGVDISRTNSNSEGNFIPLGRIGIESSENDLKKIVYAEYINAYSYPDSNQNRYSSAVGYVKLDLTLISREINNIYSMKLFYSANNGPSAQSILYGSSSSLVTVTGSSPFGTSNTYYVPIVPSTTIHTKGSYKFYIYLYDKNGQSITKDPIGSFTSNLESVKDDTRKFLLDFINFEKLNDADNDSFPSNYKLKIRIKSSDSTKLSGLLSLTIIPNPTSGSYFTTLLTNSITTGDTLTTLITGGTTLSHAYYDFAVYFQEGLSPSVSTNGYYQLPTGYISGQWDKSTNSILEKIPIEKIREDK